MKLSTVVYALVVVSILSMFGYSEITISNCIASAEGDSTFKIQCQVSTGTVTGTILITNIKNSTDKVTVKGMVEQKARDWWAEKSVANFLLIQQLIVGKTWTITEQ